jgi:hypothetical protein
VRLLGEQPNGGLGGGASPLIKLPMSSRNPRFDSASVIGQEGSTTGILSSPSAAFSDSLNTVSAYVSSSKVDISMISAAEYSETGISTTGSSIGSWVSAGNVASAVVSSADILDVEDTVKDVSIESLDVVDKVVDISVDSLEIEKLVDKVVDVSTESLEVVDKTVDVSTESLEVVDKVVNVSEGVSVEVRCKLIL